MKKLTQVLLLALLVCLLVLPMTFMVGAADGDTVEGYYYVDRFKTNWAGSYITNGAGWGYKWVRSDGANNGSILIPNGLATNDQVTLSEGGVLSFWNIGGAKCKVQVFELAMNKVESGPAMMKFDLLFNETFSGFDMSYSNNSQNRTLFHATAEGKLTVTDAFTDTGWSLAEGWNTVYIYFLPKYPEVDNPNTPSVDETTVQNGVACFYALENSERQVPDTRGVTLENLRAQTDVYYEFDYSFTYKPVLETDKDGKPTKYGPDTYADLRHISTQLWTKAVTPENKGYSLANMEYFNLEKGPLYSVNYTGYPELTSYVSMTDLANSTLAVPGAEGVTYWKGVDANGNEGYYAVGDTVKVLSSMTMSKAEGDDLLIAELGAAIAKVQIGSIPSYTYVEIDAALADLNTAMTNFTQGGGSTENEYYVQAVQVSAVLNSAKSARKQASDELIEYAGVFSDLDEDLETRMKAYENALALNGAYDGTYVDDSGYLCQNAIYALDEFTASVVEMDGAWEDYLDGLDELEEADSSTDYAPIIDKLLNAIYQIRRSGFPLFANFNKADDDENIALILAAYQNQYMNGMKTSFDALAGIPAKYEFLCDWAEDYNNYKAILKINKDTTVPAPLMQAIDDYNALVEENNLELQDALTLMTTAQYQIIRHNNLASLLADIYSKIEALMPVYEEEE